MTNDNGPEPEAHARGCPLGSRREDVDQMWELVEKARKITLGQLIDVFSGVFSKDREDYLAVPHDMPPKRKRRA